MFGTFRRPIGAAADVRELEYISALHQTSSVLHTDGTVSAQDVLYFLRSRYGLHITSDDAMDIVRGLAGTSRLPLPRVETKVWRLKKEAAAKDPHKKNTMGCKCIQRCKYCKTAEEEDEEDKLAALEAQIKSLRETNTDTRRGWEFPAMQRQTRRTVPKNVNTLVRYDLVQMMSMLLIPSILRIERRRFKAEKDAPPPRPPLLSGYLNVYNLLWHSSKMADKIIRAPIALIQKCRQKRLTKIKESLQPKPDTLLLDVLRILLGSLEARDSPFAKLSHFAAPDDSTTSGTTMTFTTSGKGKYFPALQETIVTKELIQRILEHCQQEQAAHDDDLVEQMMEVVGGEGAILDERAFATALTSDVKRWPLECEDDVTSTFYDVYGFGNVECNDYAKELTPEDLLAAPSRETAWIQPMASKNLTSYDTLHNSSDMSFHSAETELPDMEKAIRSGFAKVDDSANPTQSVETPGLASATSSVKATGSVNVSNSENSVMEGRPRRMGKIPEFRPSAGYIDYACDSVRILGILIFIQWFGNLMLTLTSVLQFSSLQLVAFLFSFFIALSVGLVFIVNYTQAGQLDCQESFQCELAQTVVNWVVLAVVLW